MKPHSFHFFNQSFKYCLRFICLWGLFSFSNTSLFSQNQIINDTSKFNLKTDTISTDSLNLKKNSKVIESRIDYSATDSVRFDMISKKVYLYRKGEIKYQKIDLKSGQIEVEFDKRELRACGIKDTNGRIGEKPEFNDDGTAFKSEELYYNFDTKKGVITTLKTQEGESYIHGERVKKMENDVTYIKHGKFTTCDDDHPHFDIRFNRAKMIPNDKIVTGPAMIYIADVPTPLFIPFGFFPNKKGQSSGIIIPNPGSAPRRGFFFKEGGYFFAFSDKLNLKLTGDIYSRGSWAIRGFSNYAKRYKYNGSINLSYSLNKYGEQGDPDFEKSRDFSIQWVHNQDPKAHPNHRLSANVNLVSSNSYKYSLNANSYFTNTTQSSINYTTNLWDRFSMSVDFSQTYNINTGDMNINLPSITLNSTQRYYPLKHKKQVGKTKWYENINLNYSLRADNQLNTNDSALLDKKTFKNMKNGMVHSIPINSSFNIFKFINISNSINYTERWYTQTVEKRWISDTTYQGADTILPYLEVTKSNRFAAARDFSFNASASTRMYGIVQFKRGPIVAIRHVLNPSVSFSYRPDFSQKFWGYYKTYTDKYGKEVPYSIFEEGIYGSPPSQKYGSIGFSLGNNLEMKVRSKKDTVSGTTKIVLIESFSLSTAYNLAADSLNWSPISLYARTTLFKKIAVSYSSIWDPYVILPNGQRINQFEWTKNRRFLRLENTTWTFDVSWSLNSKGKTASNPLPLPSGYDYYGINEVLGQQVDFSIPWNFSVNYNYRYTSSRIASLFSYTKTYVQSLGMSFDMNVTPKWKVGVRSGYDFETGEFTYTSLDIYRDLHCWEMLFNWIPFGYRSSWNFTIRVKANMLRESLKYEKKNDYRDRR